MSLCAESQVSLNNESETKMIDDCTIKGSAFTRRKYSRFPLHGLDFSEQIDRCISDVYDPQLILPGGSRIMCMSGYTFLILNLVRRRAAIGWIISPSITKGTDWRGF